MPFKSQAQRRFMYAAKARGDVPKGTAAEMQKETPKGAKLPDKIKTAAFDLGLLHAMEKLAVEVKKVPPQLQRRPKAPKAPTPIAEGKRGRRKAREWISKSRGDVEFGIPSGAPTRIRKSGFRVMRETVKGMSKKKKAGLIAAGIIAAGGVGAAIERSTRPSGQKGKP